MATVKVFQVTKVQTPAQPMNPMTARIGGTEPPTEEAPKAHVIALGEEIVRIEYYCSMETAPFLDQEIEISIVAKGGPSELSMTRANLTKAG